MRPQTIVFFDIPYRSRLVTTLAVVRALVERGHPVYAFGLEPLRELIEASGAELVLQPEFAERPPDCTVNLRAIEYALTAVPAIVAELERLRPALVVHTAKCLWAAIAAERCGLPTAVIHTNALWPAATPVSPEVYAARWPDKREDTLTRIEQRDRAAWERCVAHFATQIDVHEVLPGLPNCMNLRGDLNLVYCAESLQPLRARFDPSFEFVGPCYDDRGADRDPQFEAALAELPRPIIYASLGSIRMYNDRLALFRTMLEALADGRRGVVMAVGSDEIVAALGRTANTLIRAYVPQLCVLEQAALFVTHAGTNSVYEALLAGVPMLMLPQGGDQPIVAEQLERLGLGEWLLVGVAELRARVERMLGDVVLADAAAAAGEALRRAGGTARAAELLSTFADRSAFRRPCESAGRPDRSSGRRG